MIRDWLYIFPVIREMLFIFFVIRDQYPPFPTPNDAASDVEAYGTSDGKVMWLYGHFYKYGLHDLQTS